MSVACTEPGRLPEQHKTQDLMKTESFSTQFRVKQPADAVYAGISNFRAWWSESIVGPTDQLQQEFFYHYKDVHLCKLKLIEAQPGKRLVYLVLANEFNFVDDKTEWLNTKLVFDIKAGPDSTELCFTHEGLVPEYQCYKVCEDAWTSYIQGSLKSLIETGQGRPNPAEGGLNQALVEKWGLPNK